MNKDDNVHISDEEILAWLQEDSDGILEKVRNNHPGEEVQRMGRWVENMEDSRVSPIQLRLNVIGEQFQIRREKLGKSREDVAKELGIQVETLRYLEHGWTDSQELGRIIKKWADILQLDGEAFQNVVPGPSSHRGVF